MYRSAGQRITSKTVPQDHVATDRTDGVVDFDFEPVHRRGKVFDPARLQHDANRVRIRFFRLQSRVATELAIVLRGGIGVDVAELCRSNAHGRALRESSTVHEYGRASGGARARIG